MSWRVLYIEESEHLSLYLTNIKVRKGIEDFLIPIKDVHTIILDNYKINLSVHLINALTKANVNVVLCGVDHLPQSVLTPIKGNHMSSLVLREQVLWSDELKAQIQQLIIRLKIENQSRLIEFLFNDNMLWKRFQEFKNEVLPGDIGNREGLVAKMYFRRLFGEIGRAHV